MKEVKDSDEIKELMKSKKPVAIFYYAAWCGHCRVMHSPWEKLEKMSPNMEFYKMESEDIPDELGISGYPHFSYVKDGKLQKTVDGEKGDSSMKDEDRAKLLQKELLGGLRGARRRTRSRRLRRTRRKISH